VFIVDEVDEGEDGEQWRKMRLNRQDFDRTSRHTQSGTSSLLQLEVALMS
jgi:hypothetical protein